jgi:hypothetical protein
MRDASNASQISLGFTRSPSITPMQAPLWLRRSRSLGSALSSSSEPLLGSRPAKGYFHMSSSARAWVPCSTVPSPRSTVSQCVFSDSQSSYEHVYRTRHSGLSHPEYALHHFYFRADSSPSRLVRGWMRSTGGARKGVGVGNVRCKDGLPGVVGLPGLAL